jgi:hypothetical protein
VLLGPLAALWIVSSACQLGDGGCLRMSDCDKGYACVDGVCESDLAADAKGAVSDDAGDDTGAPTVAVPTPSTSSTDASVDAPTSDATDAGTDGPSTDAAPDA